VAEKKGTGVIRIPYRWTWHTFHKNIWSVVDDIYRGIANVIRWAPVIWYDADFDWDYLANVMEYKLRRMANWFDEWGNHVNAEHDARQMRVCAELLKRLRDDDYWENAKIRFGATAQASKYAGRHAANDQAYLGKTIGKHLRCWWD
jgi:hypothetical protein